MESEASPLRLYLASVPGDMDGERAIIEGMVLPELRALAAKVGIKISLVDPSKETDAPWDLARRFREIEACRPFFIALIGERYGEPPSAVPLELVAAQPWLVEDPGRSVLEIEILHGALRDPSKAMGSFFYFRDPLSVEGQRVSLLKDRIRVSGRPAFDGYPGLDALAERMLEDLWRALQEHAGRTPEPRSFDPNATILASSSALLPPLPVASPPRPPLPPEVAAARPQGLPPLPPGYGPSSRSGLRWLPVVLIALAVIGLAVFLIRRAASPEPGASQPLSPQQEADNLEEPDRVPVIQADIWPLMANVCGLDETATRELPGRAQGGAPIVRVYSSINTEEAHGVLSRLQGSGAFLLPIEEDGRTFCTVALGPFPTLDSAREYAGGLRVSGIAPEAELAYFPFFSR